MNRTKLEEQTTLLEAENQALKIAMQKNFDVDSDFVTEIHQHAYLQGYKAGYGAGFVDGKRDILEAYEGADK